MGRIMGSVVRIAGFAAMLLAFLVLPAFAAGDAGGADTVEGVIKAVASGNVIKFSPASDPSGQKTANVLINSATLVTLDGKSSNVGALRAGMAITFSKSEEEGILTHLDAFTLIPDSKPHTVDRGILDPPDKDKPDELAFMDGAVKRTVALTPDTQIILDSRAAKIDDLRHGMPVTVTYKSGKASLVQAFTAEMDGTARRCEGEFVSGDAKTLVIHVWGTDGFDVKMTLSDDFKITRNSKPAKMADFKVGEKVGANYVDGIATDLSLQPPPVARGGNAPAPPRDSNAPIDMP